MKKSSILIILLSGVFSLSMTAKQITTILFDVEAVFESDEWKASSYVGKLNGLSYIAQKGHKPKQEDLFKILKPIKAISTEHTYNNNLEMPLILCDWLAQTQNNSKLKDIINKYLVNKNILDIEIKVFIAIISMMLTPQHLANIQKVRSKIETILKTLRQKGYKLYLVGNWAHINSLKEQFGDIFKYFNDSIMSGDTHLLKPSQAYYQDVLEKNNIEASQAIWIETEQKFASKAKHYGYNVILASEKNYNSVITGLKNFGIII
ncbi:HAD hydrolase-like protein [Candidatus Dependentiae bacterium]|nr:HAD hydrolase-like protein [Candidatus Dependentiae bacterium]